MLKRLQAANGGMVEDTRQVIPDSLGGIPIVSPADPDVVAELFAYREATRRDLNAPLDGGAEEPGILR